MAWDHRNPFEEWTVADESDLVHLAEASPTLAKFIRLGCPRVWGRTITPRAYNVYINSADLQLTCKGTD